MKLKNNLGVIAIMLLFLFVITGLAYALAKKYDSNTKEITETVTTSEESVPTETTTEKITEILTSTSKLQTTTAKPHVTTTKKELGLVSPYEYNYIGYMRVTGYTEEEGFPYGSQTAWDYGSCKPGICAMNRHEMKTLGIHYGDYIYVKDIGEFRIEDCTADYITNTVDLWVYTNAEAYQLTGNYEVYKRV